MAEKSKILIIGGTGYIGKHIVEASVKAGHHTFALVRESTKAKLLHNFTTMGVNLVHVRFQTPTLNLPYIIVYHE
jgi:phenylcoumaran benzylic ether reductase